MAALTEEIKEKLDRFFQEDKAKLMFEQESLVKITLSRVANEKASPDTFFIQNNSWVMPLKKANGFIAALGVADEVDAMQSGYVPVKRTTSVAIDYIESTEYRRSKLAHRLNINKPALDEYLDGREELPF